MDKEGKNFIFHIDVNSAYLSWSSVERLQHGGEVDFREIPSVVGGDEESRHGIVLAKSIPAKAYGIVTGESLFSARQKCPSLTIIPPDYHLYMRCSGAMMELLKEYSPIIQRYSVDECFVDMGAQGIYSREEIEELGESIRERIKKELGFTVSIGIATNKLLAKMASELRKPDKVNTIYKEEIDDKLWPLPVGDLFMVGRATLPKLNKLNIFTIGDLAHADKCLLEEKLKSQGTLLWHYANGEEYSTVKEHSAINMKGMGNSTTISFDVEDMETANRILLSLTEMVCLRLRASKNCCGLVAVSLKDNNFTSYSRQHKLGYYTDSTNSIYEECLSLFKELWNGKPIRQMGVRVSELCSRDFVQCTIFQNKWENRNRALDNTLDSIREKYGMYSVQRAVFINSGCEPVKGGVGEENYPMMSSLL